MRGMILRNNKTEGHGQWLSSRGYSVKAGNFSAGKNAGKSCWEIDCSQTMDGTYSFHNWEGVGAWLSEVVKRKCLLTYRTRICVGSSTYFGVPLCGILESRWKGFSALIASADKVKGGFVEPEYEVLWDTTPAPVPTPAPTRLLIVGKSVKERLAELKELYQEDCITEEEYNSRRGEILASI